MNDQGDAVVRSSMTLSQLIPVWEADVLARGRAARTIDQYHYSAARVAKEIGQLRIGECTVGRIDAFMQRVAASSGPAAATMCRKVLSGMFVIAVRHGAVDNSPVHDLTPLPSSKRPVRALTADEADRIVDALRADEHAVLYDLPDPVEFMLGTECRIGEVLALRERACDLDAGTVEICATAVRAKGAGMVIQERTKTASGWRVLAVPPYVVAMLRRRKDELRFRSGEGVVFGSPLASTVRDQSNFSNQLRAALNRIDRPDGAEAGPFSWVTAHTFRKTVATRLDDAGLSSRQIADQLGHANPSMTTDVYMGRKVTVADAARLLDR